MADNTINNSENSNIIIMNSTCIEYIKHLERLVAYKDTIIADKENKIQDILNTYKEHIYEKDRQMVQVMADSYRRNEIKIAMLQEKDTQINKLLDEISSLRGNVDKLMNHILSAK